jgi:hypothetical protein
MRLQLALIAAATAFAATAAQAAEVEIKDAVARVTVVPEDRSDVRVEIIAPNAKLPLAVRTEGGRTVIDGGLWHRIRNCNGLASSARVRVRGVGEVTYAEMPQVVIHTPKAVDLSTTAPSRAPSAAPAACNCTIPAAAPGPSPTWPATPPCTSPAPARCAWAPPTAST